MMDAKNVMEVLRKCEWLLRSGPWTFCPVCQNNEIDKHDPTCELAALIAAAEHEAQDTGGPSDTEMLDWLQARASTTCDTSLGMEEFSERYVVWDDDREPAYLGTSTTSLREAIRAATKADTGHDLPPLPVEGGVS